MPGAVRRMYPARTSRRCDGTSASAGSSRRVRRNSCDIRVTMRARLLRLSATFSALFGRHNAENVALKGSEQHRHERAAGREADMFVGAPSRLVEVVDVKTHDRCDLPAAGLDAGPHPGDAQTLAPTRRFDPDPLYLAGGLRGRADFGLEDNLSVLDPRERTTRLHELCHPGAVEGAAVGRDR